MSLNLLLVLIAVAAALPTELDRVKRGNNDTGNCDLVSFGTSLTEDGIGIKDKHGFRKFCNGPVWPDYLQVLLGCSKSYNYGYAGALSGNDNYYFKGFSGNLWQINEFIEDSKIFESTIAAIEAGGVNDLFLSVGADESTLAKVEQAVLDDNVAALQKLLKAGVSRIILMDLWEAADHMPATQEDWFKPHVDTYMKSLKNINKNLAAKVKELQEQNPMAKLVLVKTAGWGDEMDKKLKKPTEAFTHHKTDTTFGEWDQYGFFDEYHPTAVVQNMWADNIFKAWKDSE